MYTPKHFQAPTQEEVLRIIRENEFATLISQVDGKPWATHIPLQLKEKKNGKKVLVGHMSIVNPQWESFKDQEAMAIFQGPHTYVSSSWYEHF